MKEVIFTRVRDKHKQIQTDNTWNVHAYCTDCTYPKCVVCQQRKPNPDTGRRLESAHTWVCASCHDTNVVCVTCGHSDLPGAFAWDTSKGQPACQPYCWPCFVKQKKPTVWTKFAKLCCHTCQTSDLTLHAFQPALAKEIFWNPKFSWSRQRPSCLACRQEPLLTCSLCAVTAPGIDFVSSDGKPPICYRCFFQRDHPIRFATFAGLTCPGCQQADLTLVAFPPAVARKILTINSFRFSRAKQFCSLCASKSQAGQNAFPKCVVCRQRKPNLETGKGLECAHTWVCASCHDTNVVCVTCGHSDLPDALAWDTCTGQLACQPYCWRCFLKTKKPAVWTKFTKLCCHTCQTSDLTLLAFQPALAKEIFLNPKFSWSRHRPSCLACMQKPLLTCSLCDVTASEIDFVSSDGRPPICYRCVFKRDHARRFATFAGLICAGCEEAELTLTAFPPAVARKILTVRSFRFSQTKQFCSLCASNGQGSHSAPQP